MDVDVGQLVGCRLGEVAVVMGLDELGPVGGRATSRRHWRRVEWFAQVRRRRNHRCPAHMARSGCRQGNSRASATARATGQQRKKAALLNQFPAREITAGSGMDADGLRLVAESRRRRSVMKAINDLQRRNKPLRMEILQAFERVLDSGHFILGLEGTEFEQEFAAYCRVDHCIAVGNGTDALELGLRACGVGPDDVVAAVANAGLYGTTAIRAVQARPAYADVDPSTGLMRLDRLAEICRHRRPKAVIVTHLYGRMIDMRSVMEITDSHGALVIEDCAQAHGAVLAGRAAGTWGALGCFSFYPTKNLGALGDAGAVITSDATVAARLRRLRQYGWRAKYEADLTGGRNSRMDELQAAVLRRLLPRLDGWNDRRRCIAAAYDAGIRHPLVRSLAGQGRSYVAHLYVIACRERESLRSHLDSRGIPTAVHYPIPDHLQAAQAAGESHAPQPCAEALARQVLTLPCFPEMADAEVASVIAGANSWRP